MNRSFRIATALTLAGAMGMSVLASAAQAQANCLTYGNLALKQARENEQRKCGHKGPRWSTDLKAHIAWCGQVGPTEWRTELKERAKALQGCAS